jgi:hypothetical protein
MDGPKVSSNNISWEVDQNSGLYRWVLADTVPSSNVMKWGSRGYVHLKGSPINPYVVPGGEDLIVGAANYPPNYRTLDSLLAAKAPQDVIDRFVETLPSYYSNILYDNCECSIFAARHY